MKLFCFPSKWKWEVCEATWTWKPSVILLNLSQTWEWSPGLSGYCLGYLALFNTWLLFDLPHPLLCCPQTVFLLHRVQKQKTPNSKGLAKVSGTVGLILDTSRAWPQWQVKISLQTLEKQKTIHTWCQEGNLLERSNQVERHPQEIMNNRAGFLLTPNQALNLDNPIARKQSSGQQEFIRRPPRRTRQIDPGSSFPRAEEELKGLHLASPVYKLI